MITAFERFMETSLGLYAIGARTESGFRPRRRQQINVTLPAVLALFRGDAAFVGWVDPQAVTRRAEKWLRGGEPFQTALTPLSALLVYVLQMRNVIAHESDSAFDKYEKATRHLYGALPSRLQPGEQLMSPPPGGLAGVTGASLFSGVVTAYRWIGAAVVR